MRYLVVIFSAILIVLGILVVKTQEKLELPVSSESFVLEVKEGDNFNKILDNLEKKGVKVNRILAKVAYFWTVGQGTIKSGVYSLDESDNLNSLFFKLNQGSSLQSKLTIIEGETVSQVVDFLTKVKWLKGEITRVPKEGMLAPGTYNFSVGTARQKVIDFLEAEQKRIVQALYKKKSPDLPFRNWYQLVVFASVVEKEMANLDEASKVAEVFANRLKKGQNLEASATVIYANSLKTGKRLKRLFFKDIEADNSHYNTYKNKGLPPSAICNPGEKTIMACLNPTKFGYFYFVKDPFKKGHNFSKTFEEHNNNVQDYYKSLPKVPARKVSLKKRYKKIMVGDKPKKKSNLLKNLYGKARNVRLNKNRRYA